MGLISYLKRKFSKDIYLSNDISNHLVYVQKTKKGKIWLNSKLFVPNDFMFVIGKSGKIFDVFKSGEWELKAVYLPKSVKRFNLEKKQKNGSFPKSFACDAYFVNLKTFEYEKYRTYRKLELFDEKFGYFKVSLSGGFAYKVVDGEKFMKALLKVYDFLKPYEAVEILKDFMSDFVVNEIEKSKLDYKAIKNTEQVTDLLFRKIDNKFKNYGVDIVGFSIEKIKFSKKFLTKVEKLTFEGMQNLTCEEPKNVQDEFTYQIQEPQELSCQIIKNSNHETETKRCLFCGAKNKKDAKECMLCGEKMQKE